MTVWRILHRAMSEFCVVTDEIQTMSTRLGVIPSDVEEITRQMGPHAAAAAQTCADGAMGELMGRWAAVLPQFGLSGGRLQAAMGGAAAAYDTTDAVVADAASGDAAAGPGPAA